MRRNLFNSSVLAVVVVLLSLSFTLAADSTGEVVTVATLPLNAEQPQVERFLTYYPKEIYIGDPVYVVEYNRNASNKAIARFPEPLPFGLSIGAVDATVDCELCAEPYRFAFEQDSNSLTMRVTRALPLLPGEKRLAAVRVFEFPPLEDWDAPFWKTLKENFSANPSQSATCRFTLKVPHYTEDGALERRPVELELVVKPRPASGRPSETSWLDAWKKQTPETLFPKRRVEDRGDVKLPPFGRLRSHVSDVVVGERLYDSWAFVRRGNRKPSDPNAPPVASEWRRLETTVDVARRNRPNSFATRILRSRRRQSVRRRATNINRLVGATSGTATRRFVAIAPFETR